MGEKGRSRRQTSNKYEDIEKEAKHWIFKGEDKQSLFKAYINEKISESHFIF